MTKYLAATMMMGSSGGSQDEGFSGDDGDDLLDGSLGFNDGDGGSGYNICYNIDTFS